MSTAEDFKEQGNTLFKAKRFNAAVEMYTQAINASMGGAEENQHVYYTNRAFAHLKSNQNEKAMRDAQKAANLKPDYTKAHMRMGDALKAQGHFTRSLKCFQKALETSPANRAIITNINWLLAMEKALEDADKNLDSGRPGEAAQTFIQLHNELPHAHVVTLKLANCLAKTGKGEEADELIRSVLRAEPTNISALVARANMQYINGSLGNAQQIARNIMALDPDNSLARRILKNSKKLLAFKEAGNAAFKAKEYADAIAAYSSGLELESTVKTISSQLFSNRAAAYLKMGEKEKALEDCNSGIALDGSYLKLFNRRASLNQELENWDEAVRDYQRVIQLSGGRPTQEQHDNLQYAKEKQKEANRKDYYEILGVSKNASEKDIKRAYKRKALRCHPDKMATKTEEEKAAATKEFELVAEAHEVLTDSQKKAIFDQGGDPMDKSGGMGGGNPFGGGGFDPSDLFSMFMGGGGMGGGRRGGGHPMGGGGGMPFSFHFG